MIDYQTLGDTFAARLRERLTPQEWQMMRFDNAAETHPNICHSADYCDSNMVMDAALADHGVNIWTDDGEQMREDVQNLWNDAWTYARRRYLTAPRPVKVGAIGVWHDDAPGNYAGRLWKVTAANHLAGRVPFVRIAAVEWDRDTEEYRPEWWAEERLFWCLLDGGVLEL